MPGSMDDNPPLIIAGHDYDYFLLSRKGSFAEVHVSAQSEMTKYQIADELRRVARFVEGTDG